MSIQPISRNTLRTLKAVTDEENHKTQLDQHITTIYYNVINVAKTTTSTSYEFPVDYRGFNIALNSEFIKANIAAIISGLQSHFPDTVVSQKTLSRGFDGKMYDVSKTNPFINGQFRADYIVIDWS